MENFSNACNTNLRIWLEPTMPVFLTYQICSKTSKIAQRNWQGWTLRIEFFKQFLWLNIYETFVHFRIPFTFPPERFQRSKLLRATLLTKLKSPNPVYVTLKPIQCSRKSRNNIYLASGFRLAALSADSLPLRWKLVFIPECFVAARINSFHSHISVFVFD